MIAQLSQKSEHAYCLMWHVQRMLHSFASFAQKRSVRSSASISTLRSSSCCSASRCARSTAGSAPTRPSCRAFGCVPVPCASCAALWTSSTLSLCSPPLIRTFHAMNDALVASPIPGPSARRPHRASRQRATCRRTARGAALLYLLEVFLFNFSRFISVGIVLFAVMHCKCGRSHD